MFGTSTPPEASLPRAGLRPGLPSRRPSVHTCQAYPARSELLSFFDEGDEPRGEARRAPRPRQPAAPRSGAAEHQTLMVRRAVAIGGGVFLLVLLVLVINSCQDNARKNALKDYNDDVARLVQASDEQVGVPLFRLLGRRPDSPLDRQTQINQLRITADEQVSDAEDLDVPDDADDSRGPLLDVLRFRRDGVANIARRVPTALGRQVSGVAVTAIAVQMQQFLASHVIYSQRVYPEIATALRDADVGGLPRRSRFLPSLEWLAHDTVADRLGSTGGTGPGGTPAAGLHGFGLTSTSAGATALQPGTTNRIAASA